ncbi:magnesium-dependent phosphatase-1, partial [Meira miltonrushii]
LPKLVAFDLDYTVWPTWVDTSVDGPLKRRGEDINKVYDRSGSPLSLYPHVPAILFFLQSKQITVAAASRTCAPTIARQALNNLLIVDDGVRRLTFTPIPTMKLFDQLEIYPGSKITHFRKINEKTGIPFEDMIFFDDEHRNAEVSTKLGVHFELVGHQGTDLATFENAIRQWRAKK